MGGGITLTLSIGELHVTATNADPQEIARAIAGDELALGRFGRWWSKWIAGLESKLYFMLLFVHCNPIIGGDQCPHMVRYCKEAWAARIRQYRLNRRIPVNVHHTVDCPHGCRVAELPRCHVNRCRYVHDVRYLRCRPHRVSLPI